MNKETADQLLDLAKEGVALASRAIIVLLESKKKEEK